nr:uncharacterized protein LOC128688383 [Cherax quadricarinatus]
MISPGDSDIVSQEWENHQQDGAGVILGQVGREITHTALNNLINNVMPHTVLDSSVTSSLQLDLQIAASWSHDHHQELWNVVDELLMNTSEENASENLVGGGPEGGATSPVQSSLPCPSQPLQESFNGESVGGAPSSAYSPHTRSSPLLPQESKEPSSSPSTLRPEYLTAESRSSGCSTPRSPCDVPRTYVCVPEDLPLATPRNHIGSTIPDDSLVIPSHQGRTSDLLKATSPGYNYNCSTTPDDLLVAPRPFYTRNSPIPTNQNNTQGFAQAATPPTGQTYSPQ